MWHNGTNLDTDDDWQEQWNEVYLSVDAVTC
jgi:hypothetical protein